MHFKLCASLKITSLPIPTTAADTSPGAALWVGAAAVLEAGGGGDADGRGCCCCWRCCCTSLAAVLLLAAIAFVDMPPGSPAPTRDEALLQDAVAAPAWWAPAGRHAMNDGFGYLLGHEALLQDAVAAPPWCAPAGRHVMNDGFGNLLMRLVGVCVMNH